MKRQKVAAPAAALRAQGTASITGKVAFEGAAVAPQRISVSAEPTGAAGRGGLPVCAARVRRAERASGVHPRQRHDAARRAGDGQPKPQLQSPPADEGDMEFTRTLSEPEVPVRWNCAVQPWVAVRMAVLADALCSVSGRGRHVQFARVAGGRRCH
jgi:hypothetical protein